MRLTKEEVDTEFIEIQLLNTKYAVQVYYLIAPVEASVNLARFYGVSYGFRKEKD